MFITVHGTCHSHMLGITVIVIIIVFIYIIIIGTQLILPNIYLRGPFLIFKIDAIFLVLPPFVTDFHLSVLKEILENYFVLCKTK